MNRKTCLSVSVAGAIAVGVAAFAVATSNLTVSAARTPGESTVVAVTPARVLDTRDPVNLGLAGPFVSPVSQKLQITGSIPTSNGPATVVPSGSTGVLLNVTVVSPQAAGFVSVRPGDATGQPSTSSLNFAAGAIAPNSVQVALPTSGADAGKIDLTYDAFGQAGPGTDLLVDVVGYTTSAGIDELANQLAGKANAADVYTKATADATFASKTETKVLTAINAGGAQNDGSCVRLRNDNFSNFYLDLGVPRGARITELRVRGTDEDGIADGMSIVLIGSTGFTQEIGGGSYTSESGSFDAPMQLLPTVSTPPGDVGWYVYGSSNAHPGTRRFCGAVVTYTVP